MRISPHFTLEEMTLSQTASRLGLDNTPPPEVVDHLVYVAAKMESVRTLLGSKVIVVSSGYRSPEVNKAVGGAADSAHMSGYAVDFICPEFGMPIAVCQEIAESALQFDQLIMELGRWVHISFAPTMRRQVMLWDGDKYYPYENNAEKDS